ncbi:unnamed protein product [Pieris macdunnoughi]|uniref:Uncharacterized protein n=1 Tax=Pieris macdunnoughi TaxID=345717 RepID=A0A821PB62_9NEOP|nr:unnamed protein product [Pieris macdunnoughi]
MSKKIIESRAREIIIKVDNYFVREKEETEGLIQTVSRCVKNTPDNSEDVIISKKIVTEILKHLKNTTRVTERVLSATGIAKNTVTKLRREKEIALASGTKIRTPIKKSRGKKVFFDAGAILELRNIIKTIEERKEILTMRKIMATAQEDLNYKGGETTLRQIIKNELGYTFKNLHKISFESDQNIDEVYSEVET